MLMLSMESKPPAGSYKLNEIVIRVDVRTLGRLIIGPCSTFSEQSIVSWPLFLTHERPTNSHVPAQRRLFRVVRSEQDKRVAEDSRNTTKNRIGDCQSQFRGAASAESKKIMAIPIND